MTRPTSRLGLGAIGLDGVALAHVEPGALAHESPIDGEPALGQRFGSKGPIDGAHGDGPGSASGGQGLDRVGVEREDFPLKRDIAGPGEDVGVLALGQRDAQALQLRADLPQGGVDHPLEVDLDGAAARQLVHIQAL